MGGTVELAGSLPVKAASNSLFLVSLENVNLEVPTLPESVNNWIKRKITFTMALILSLA